MSASDSSEDDFMSDKYLQQAETATAGRSKTQTYAQRRQEAYKRHLEAQPKSRKVREEQARKAALETSLFDAVGAGTGTSVGQGAGTTPPPTTTGAGKAMGMMMKMGWKVGEGLGKRSLDPPPTQQVDSEAEDSVDMTSDTGKQRIEAADGFTDSAVSVGNKRRKISPEPTTSNSATSTPAFAATPRKPLTQPLRISMWAGKLGVGAHQRSPSPEDMSFLSGISQGDGKMSREAMARLQREADDFRRRRAGVDEEKRIQQREWAARRLLMEFDEARGIKFHPLWVIPSAAGETIPRPLLRLIDPSFAETLDLAEPDDEQRSWIQGRSDEGNMDEAERLREQMRRDALVTAVGEEEGEDLAFNGAKKRSDDPGRVPVDLQQDKKEEQEEPVDWASFVPGVRRVLAMSPSTHLAYLVSSLRADHLYCFWCAAQYGSVEEMEGPGGCPGEEEDDH